MHKAEGASAADEAAAKDALAQAASQKRSDSTMSGRIEDVPVPDLLQLFQTSKRSGVLVIKGDQTGKIYLRDGRVYYAIIGDDHDLGPQKSFNRMVAWEQGVLELAPPTGEEFMIELDESTEALLMEALRQLDELRQIRPSSRRWGPSWPWRPPWPRRSGTSSPSSSTPCSWSSTSRPCRTSSTGPTAPTSRPRRPSSGSCARATSERRSRPPAAPRPCLRALGGGGAEDPAGRGVGREALGGGAGGGVGRARMWIALMFQGSLVVVTVGSMVLVITKLTSLFWR